MVLDATVVADLVGVAWKGGTRVAGIAADALANVSTRTIAREGVDAAVNEATRIASNPVTKGAGGLLDEAATWGACFVAGTLVWTAEGSKPIEAILAGDLVVSADENRHQTVLKPVTRLFKRTAPQILRLSLENANGTVETLGTTPEHPFHVPSRGFVGAKHLYPGDLVTSGARVAQKPLLLASSKENGPAGFLKVKALSIGDRASTVYNFEVAETHTYFVGQERAWVHNACSAKDLVSNGGAQLDSQTIVGGVRQ